MGIILSLSPMCFCRVNFSCVFVILTKLSGALYAVMNFMDFVQESYNFGVDFKFSGSFSSKFLSL